MGFVFDFYRSFRRWQDFGHILTFVGDVIFSLVAVVILFNFFKRANALDFRFYIIWGSLLGLGLYLKLFSHFTLRAFFGFYRLITFITKVIHKSVKIPIRGLEIMMRPPYAILCWLSLLLYRIGELVFLKRLVQMKRRFKDWWKGLLPPRTNG